MGLLAAETPPEEGVGESFERPEQGPPPGPSEETAPHDDSAYGRTSGPEANPSEDRMDAERRFMTEAMNQMIYGGEDDGNANPGLTEALRKAVTSEFRDAPYGATDTLGRIAATLAYQLAQQTLQSGQRLDPSSIFFSFVYAIHELASVAGADGIYDYSSEELKAAAAKGTELMAGYFSELGYDLQREAKEDWGALRGMNEDGSLENLLRRASDSDVMRGGMETEGMPMGGGGGVA